MLFLDCYMHKNGEKGHVEGHPESTFEVDDESKLDKVESQLLETFAEVRRVEKTNGQAIVPLSIDTMLDLLDSKEDGTAVLSDKLVFADVST